MWLSWGGPLSLPIPEYRINNSAGKKKHWNTSSWMSTQLNFPMPWHLISMLLVCGTPALFMQNNCIKLHSTNWVLYSYFLISIYHFIEQELTAERIKIVWLPNIVYYFRNNLFWVLACFFFTPLGRAYTYTRPHAAGPRSVFSTGSLKFTTRQVQQSGVVFLLQCNSIQISFAFFILLIYGYFTLNYSSLFLLFIVLLFFKFD